MPLPAFASVEDLAARIAGGIAEADEPRAQAALDDASTLIRSVAGKDWATEGELDEDLADIIVTVTLWSARRAFENPSGISQESLGSYSYSVQNSSSDVYLTAAERAQVRKAAGLLGIGARATTRGDLETEPITDYPPFGGDTYLPVTPEGEPIIFTGPDAY